MNSHDSIVVFDSSKPPRAGVWNFVGTHNGLDHLEIIGNGVQEAYPIYQSIASQLTKLDN